MSSSWSTTASMCRQSPGGGHVDRDHIVGKPYRPDETLYKSSAHAWKKRRSSRTPLLHVLYWRDCLEGSTALHSPDNAERRTRSRPESNVEPAGMPRCCL